MTPTRIPPFTFPASSTKVSFSLRHCCLTLAALTLVFALSACSIGASAASAADTAMTRAGMLALGTLKLEGTDQAVNSAAASELLPLWELFSEVSESSKAVPQELAAVVTEIEATMTTAQLSTIDDMGISTSEIASESVTTQSASVASASSATAGGSSSRLSSPPADAGMLAGGGPPDAAGGMGIAMETGAGISAQTSSVDAAASAAASTSGAPTALVRQVIKLLESKVQG